MGGCLKIFKASKETLCYANKDIHENDSIFNWVVLYEIQALCTGLMPLPGE